MTAPHFEGPPRLVQSGETKAVGGNVSSVLLRAPTGVPPVSINTFCEDANTTYLFHFGRREWEHGFQLDRSFWLGASMVVLHGLAVVW